MPSLVETGGPVILEKEMEMWKFYNNNENHGQLVLIVTGTVTDVPQTFPHP